MDIKRDGLLDALNKDLEDILIQEEEHKCDLLMAIEEK